MDRRSRPDLIETRLQWWQDGQEDQGDQRDQGGQKEQKLEDSRVWRMDRDTKAEDQQKDP